MMRGVQHHLHDRFTEGMGRRRSRESRLELRGPRFPELVVQRQRIDLFEEPTDLPVWRRVPTPPGQWLPRNSPCRAARSARRSTPDGTGAGQNGCDGRCSAGVRRRRRQARRARWSRCMRRPTPSDGRGRRDDVGNPWSSSRPSVSHTPKVWVPPSEPARFAKNPRAVLGFLGAWVLGCLGFSVLGGPAASARK